MGRDVITHHRSMQYHVSASQVPTVLCALVLASSGDLGECRGLKRGGGGDGLSLTRIGALPYIESAGKEVPKVWSLECLKLEEQDRDPLRQDNSFRDRSVGIIWVRHARPGRMMRTSQ